MTTIHVENAQIAYRDQTVVHSVSCQAQTGELTVLVGPNGCGKSTLLKAIARVLPLQSGAVHLDALNVQSARTKHVAQLLSLLPQGPVAPEGLVVHELVAQGRFPHQSLFQQWSKDDALAVEKAMRLAGVEGFANKRLTELSGGQRQRCWIAMVLAQDTPVILLDEPTTFLDLKVQVDIMGLLARIAHHENRTVFVVLHDLNVAAAFADKMIMMRAGKIIADGPVQEVFTSANLSAVFDLRANILHDSATGRPVCVPLHQPAEIG